MKLTPKQLRIISHEIKIIISKKGISSHKLGKDFLNSYIYAPKIKYGDNELFISEHGQKSLRKICDIIYSTRVYDNLLNYNDIYTVIVSEIERWFNDNLLPDANDFIEPLVDRLKHKIEHHNLICRIDGITLDGIIEISISHRTIKKFTEELFMGISDNAANSKDLIKKEYEDKLVIIGFEEGSETVAEEKFYHKANLSLAMLSLYSCAFYKHAIDQIRIRIINDCSLSYGPASCFSWTNSKKNLCYKRYFKAVQDVPFNSEKMATLEEDYFFKELSVLIDKKNRTELEEAILKSLYWFGEVQNDLAYAPKWLKLWSCLECFFSIEKDEITEKNARGISAILVYGGYIHHKFKNYKKLKTNIKKFYDLRSRIAHRAEYIHIKASDLRELSLIVAWVTITILAISVHGCSSLTQLMQEVDRLDGIENKKSKPKINDATNRIKKILKYLKWIHKK